MRLPLLALLLASPLVLQAQTQAIPEGFLSPARPVTSGMAPHMKFKLVHQSGNERVYTIIFSPGDEVVSGLTDFAIQNHIVDAHFTGIGAVSSALTAYLVLDRGLYRALPVNEQVEVLSLIGDIATSQGKPVIHNHVVLGKHDGTTVGGHLFEAHVSPTLEVFLTADDTPLEKIPGPSNMKVIDPTR
jgi:predicted DNA-binding protein with PD1-like motif